MAGQQDNRMHCAEFDALLSQAIDSTLAGERLTAFEAHSRDCKLCGPLLQEAEAGHTWLKSLAEVEPPQELVTNVLLRTSGVLTFAMSFGMAFFTLSVTLSLAGVRLSDLRHLDLRPSAVRRTYYETSGRVVKYYENIRFVYEIESRVRQFKQAATPAEQPREQQQENNDQKDKTKNNTSGQPEQKQERNYSQEGNQPVFASLPDHQGLQPARILRIGTADPPVVSVTTYRRFV